MDTPIGAKMREECCVAKRKRRAFTAKFKAEARRLCQVGDRSVCQVAKVLRKIREVLDSATPFRR